MLCVRLRVGAHAFKLIMLLTRWSHSHTHTTLTHFVHSARARCHAAVVAALSASMTVKNGARLVALPARRDRHERERVHGRSAGIRHHSAVRRRRHHRCRPSWQQHVYVYFVASHTGQKPSCCASATELLNNHICTASRVVCKDAGRRSCVGATRVSSRVTSVKENCENMGCV